MADFFSSIFPSMKAQRKIIYRVFVSYIIYKVSIEYLWKKIVGEYYSQTEGEGEGEGGGGVAHCLPIFEWPWMVLRKVL